MKQEKGKWAQVRDEKTIKGNLWAQFEILETSAVDIFIASQKDLWRFLNYASRLPPSLSLKYPNNHSNSENQFSQVPTQDHQVGFQILNF